MKILITGGAGMLGHALAERLGSSHDLVSVDLEELDIRKWAEVWEQVNRLRPDIVLIDVSVSNGHGLEVISRLRAVQPGVGIIALALVDTDGFWQAALNAGADDFIPKFAMSTNLLPAIRRVIQANQPHGQATKPLEAQAS